MVNLNNLKDNKGARRPAKTVGRGIGSGKGKTCGSGHKGQKARTGVAIKGFEGGQMPIHRRLPKRGFNSPNRKIYQILNLGTIQQFIESGKIDAKKPINIEILSSSGIISNPKDGVKLLAKGELKTAVNLEVTKASKSAIEMVEKSGGKVKLVEFQKRVAKNPSKNKNSTKNSIKDPKKNSKVATVNKAEKSNISEEAAKATA